MKNLLLFLFLLPMVASSQTQTVTITINGTTQTLYTKYGVDKKFSDSSKVWRNLVSALDKRVAVLEKGTKFDSTQFKMVNGVFTLKSTTAPLVPPYPETIKRIEWLEAKRYKILNPEIVEQ